MKRDSHLMDLLKSAVSQDASDIFLIPGMPAAFKIHGQIQSISDQKIYPDEMDGYIRAIYALTGGRTMKRVLETGDDDFSFSVKDLSRFRASVMKQRGSLAAVIRLVRFTLPSPDQLHIPESILGLSQLSKGLVLVTGPAGSGKSTTLACIIDRINRTRTAHVITLEDPIEFLHRHQKSVVTQREVGLDTDSYVDGLRAALRQAPDVILLGEMRDYETISIAMTAAETGHLVISTLHTTGAANTIDRIIDIFPANAQQQIRVQLSMVLQAVVSQQLVPTTDGRLTPAFELMFVNKAIRNMIRESKIHQIDNMIASGAASGMISMDGSLIKLFRDGLITKDTAVTYSQDSEQLQARLR
ncbi:MAG TPA: PilT/PilU family type 4a pilus ATPase [Candidatus Lachnoclostridium pullistercoris]|uniref:PilT/PilU family type 4a pilus ATPase n=1 Tax=Candidatus Lachnoclostridium pullistercoris TaxID=2838632 RepID=A0A9D2T7W4_9FIRM|nr:PilT/PilU family type 4a pilus ATPase [Candidatus Lachnoclostridium pullistercoris]